MATVLPFPAPAQRPWTTTSGLESVLERWRADRSFSTRFVLDTALPPTVASEAPVPQDGRVRVGYGLEKCEPGGDAANPRQESDKRRSGRHASFMHQRIDMGGWDEPESAQRDNQETHNDAALVADRTRQESSGERHECITQVVRRLHPGRLRFG